MSTNSKGLNSFVPKAKFTVRSFNGVVSLDMNVTATEELFDLLDDFDTLEPTMYSLRRKLKENLSFMDSQREAREARRGDVDFGETADEADETRGTLHRRAVGS